MKLNLQPLIEERERFFVPISEFSFAAFPLQVNHTFRCLPEAANAPNDSRNLRQNVWSRRISQWLRWACGMPTAGRAAGNVSIQQTVP